MVFNLEEVERLHQRLESALSGEGRRALADEIERELRASVETAFSRAMDPVTGKPWRPRRGDPPWPPLQKTGGLREAILEAVKLGRVNMWGKIKIRDDQAAKAFIHFHGRSKRAPMPARRMAGLSEAQIQRLRRAAERLIERAVRE